MLGLAEPRPVDRLTLGAASLSLLAASAPLLVVVDDAHWLDTESQDALVFAARRLAADPVAMVFAAREGDVQRFAAEGIDELVVSGLESDHARSLLGERVSSSRVADELIESTGGNPLALLQLPQALSDAQLSGDEPLEQPIRVGAALERGFSRRVQILGEDVRLAALTVAADDSGDAAAIDTAVGSLGLAANNLTRAEDAGLLQRNGGQLGFSHPLVRSAVYHGAAPSERRRVHAALAAALADRDGERHAWHLAAAAVGAEYDGSRKARRRRPPSSRPWRIRLGSSGVRARCAPDRNRTGAGVAARRGRERRTTRRTPSPRRPTGGRGPGRSPA